MVSVNQLNAFLQASVKPVSAFADGTSSGLEKLVLNIVLLDQKISQGEAGDEFGGAVAISGDTAVVGAGNHQVGSHLFQGAACVYVRSGSTWQLQQQLTAPDGATQDYFGRAVAISGDTVVIGSYGSTVDFSDQGAAYVFQRTGTTWELQQKLIDASETQESDRFGNSVAIDGDTILVGEFLDDVGLNSGQGSVLVFTRTGETWSEQSRFTSNDGLAGDRFGQNVALSGDTALIGLPYASIGENFEQGSAYIFVRNGTSWTQQAKLTASDGSMGDNFGMSIALSGDTAIIGASSDDVSDAWNQGSAYLFIRSGSTWSEEAHLFASDGAANDRFGVSVALWGDKALIGAILDVVNDHMTGSAYLFTKELSGWIEQDKLLAVDGAGGDEFGKAVALSNSTAMVGAWRDVVNGDFPEGSVYIHELSVPYSLHLPLVIRSSP